jgi:hypothetical protein
MDNFDLRKFLTEGKLNEFMSAQDTEDIAGMVADEFTKESADKGDYLKYSVGRVEGEFFELDTEASDMSPEDLDMRGVGEGWGGNFGVKQTEDGLEVRNAEKGGLVATIDAEGNFKMLSADESRAEMGLEEAEEAPKSNKMKKSELKEMIRAAMLAEMEVEETEVFEAEEDEVADDIEVEDTEEVDVDTEEVEADFGDGEELSGDVKAVQDNLEAALEAARAMGDEKLADQIGNSITFFTRQHIVKEAMSDDEIRNMAREKSSSFGIPQVLIEPAIDVMVDMVRGMEAIGIDIQKELEDQDVSPEQLEKVKELTIDFGEKLTALIDDFSDAGKLDENKSTFPMWNKIKQNL